MASELLKVALHPTCSNSEVKLKGKKKPIYKKWRK